MGSIVRAPRVDLTRMEAEGFAPVQTAGWRAYCAPCGYLTREPRSYDQARASMREHRRTCPSAVRHAR